MMTLLRWVLSGAFVYSLGKAAHGYSSLSALETILLMIYLLVGGIVVSILWVPVIGARIAEPLTSSIVEETTLPPTQNRLVHLIRRCQARGYHRLALLGCLCEGLRHPDLPLPPLLALRSARPGSLPEKLFAREVYRYNNITNCLHAYTILKERHGETPPPHRNPEVNLAIMSLNRAPHPEPSKLEVKTNAAPVRLERNPSIKLFE
jgi:hypothetical protein